VTTLEASEDRNSEKAIEFLESFRGRYIIGQALYYAIQQLESIQPEVLQEKSNIADMKYLRDELFNIPDHMYSVADAIKEIQEDN